MPMNLINLPAIASTNTWLKENSATLPHGSVAITDNQTAGRGQRGNSWEAEPGKNLTFSILLRPTQLHPSQQFLISEIVSLAVVNALRDALAPTITPERVTVKWPNDIYVDDRKIAGILIEHSINASAIQQTVVGIGLYVNQTHFLSDAPNPVSMTALTGLTYPLPDLLSAIVEPIIATIDPSLRDDVHTDYLCQLWRADNLPHRFAYPDGTPFEATINTIDPDGFLSLTLTNGTIQRFAFKEVAFLL
jgi:BirA family biotin operon repressor/biotin-[acetyl-CoA-carboxylase] ligase